MPSEGALSDRIVQRHRLEEFYAAYCEAIDAGRYDEWVDFFDEECFYRVTARENVALGLPLGEILCESRAMLQDRVVALRQTAMYVPRLIRHFISNLRFTEAEDGLSVRTNFVLYETLADQPTQLFLSGEALDRVIERDGRLIFAERVCVHDSTVIPVSLIYPI